MAVPSAAAPPRHAVIPFSNPPPPPKKKGEEMADEESRAAILGKGHKCAQDMRIWGLAAPPASCRLLQPRANTPCLSVALCSAGVILAGRTLGGEGDYPPDYLSCYLCSSLIPRTQPPICTFSPLFAVWGCASLPNHLSIPLSICRLCFSGQIRAPKSVHPCVLRGAPTHPPAGTRRDLLRQAQCCNPDNLYPLNKASRFSLPCH